jgi:hypothetical protein
MEMNDNQKAASILRQYAGELYQGHTIGGRWPEESAHIEREHDELMALADRLARQPQERGEAVAWLIRKDTRTWTSHHKRYAEEYAAIGAEVTPLYTHPAPDAGRVAELEARYNRLGEEYEKVVAMLAMGASNGTTFERICSLEAQLAESREQITHRDNELVLRDKALDASREREGRMREALDGNKLYWLDGNPEEGGEWGDTIDRLNCNMDEPFKIGDKIKVHRALVLPDAHIVVTAVDEDGQIIECEDAALTADKEGE